MRSTKHNFAYPSDLADFVQRRLKELHIRSPALSTLTKMLEVAFFASMKTEEAEQVRCNLYYIDINNPDPSPPKRIVADRWSYIRYSEPIVFDVKNLVKISQSIYNSFCALAVYKASDGKLVIWGAIDQQGQRAAYTTGERDEGPESPGVLQICISGVGAIEVYKDYTLLGALRLGRLAYGSSDVLEQPGPIQAVFQSRILSIVRRVQSKVGKDVFHRRDHWVDSISDYWHQAFARILISIQHYGHGGAILLTPNQCNTGVSIKYPIKYRRLGDALTRFSIHTIQLCDVEDKIGEKLLDTHLKEMPVSLHLTESVSRCEKDDTRDEVAGCIHFVASLSRVDGLIVMNQELAVRGYGGIIKIKKEPSSVWVAGDAAGTVKKLHKINSSHFGTRHQSMMRICFSRSGSVGFVVSQDGDVRAMMRVRDRMIVWEDVKLRLL